MPFANSGGVRLYYRVDGPEDRPTVIFSHSLGMDHGQWVYQTADLRSHFRLVVYDLRGHGASDAPEGEYTLDELGRDVLAIAEAAGIDRFAFCGLSIGGMIGQWLGANAGHRLTHLVLANTAARYATPQLMNDRRAIVLQNGMGAIAGSIIERFFTPESLDRNPLLVASTRRTVLSTNPIGYAGCCAVVRDLDTTSSLSKISTPTLIIYGDRDQSTPWKGAAEVLASSIRSAKFMRLPTAHLSNLEQPRSFSNALFDFFLANSAPGGQDRSRAMQLRRGILGDQHVDRAIANATEFTVEFQDLVTRYAWGEIWSRPLLDARTRRLLVLTSMAVLGRWEEFRMHVRAGLARELEPCDLKEILLQASIYAGVPAGNTGFQIAAEELQLSPNQSEKV